MYMANQFYRLCTKRALFIDRAEFPLSGTPVHQSNCGNRGVFALSTRIPTTLRSAK